MLPNNLRRLRSRYNFTQEQIVNKISVTRPAYTVYEKGARDLDSNMLGKIADIYDISIDELLGRDKKKSSDYIDDKEAFDALLEDVKQELIMEINDKIALLAYKQKNKDK